MLGIIITTKITSLTNSIKTQQINKINQNINRRYAMRHKIFIWKTPTLIVEIKNQED